MECLKGSFFCFVFVDLIKLQGVEVQTVFFVSLCLTG